MRPNLASSGSWAAWQLGLRRASAREGYVNGSGGWICRRLASPVGCVVATASVDPATSWDDPGCEAPGSYEPLGDYCVPPPTARAAARLQVVPHRSLMATGSLLTASLLPPESTSVARLQATTLRARLATANAATSWSRRPSRSQ
jgi:hypothetical protein